MFDININRELPSSSSAVCASYVHIISVTSSDTDSVTRAKAYEIRLTSRNLYLGVLAVCVTVCDYLRHIYIFELFSQNYIDGILCLRRCNTKDRNVTSLIWREEADQV